MSSSRAISCEFNKKDETKIFKSSYLRGCFAVVATLLLVIIVAISCCLFDVLPVDDKVVINPDQVRIETLEKLENSKGLYDEKSIVLPNTSLTEASMLADRFDGKLRITQNGKFATITLNGDKTVLDIYKDKSNNDIITSIKPDYSARISDLTEEEKIIRQPSKPNYSVSDTLYERQTYLDYINIGYTWSKDWQGKGRTVAVIDTGIDTDHSEFEGKISEYSYYASEDKIVKDYLTEDGTYDWSLIEDEQGHGTAVAGTIAASMNGQGIVGVAPQVTLLIIKVACSPSGAFYRSSDLVFGLYYAIERDVTIVNMSFGGPENIYKDVARLGADSDVLMVAAAGNDGSATLTYPAADENVIGVGALAENEWNLADYSNYGENVDLVAPGTVYTTKIGGGYDTINGTSFASPIVAGALALLKSNYNYTYHDNNQIKELLYASCYDLGTLGKDWYFGFGALDVSALCIEERGTVTFNMLTDELEETTQVFIRNHTLQNMPEPERMYAVFDGWYYDIHCTEEYNWYADVFVGDLTLYANWVNEDDGIPFTYVTLDDGTIEIRSYTGKRRYITIPDMIENKKVTSIGDFAFQEQSKLRQVTLPKYLKNIGQYAFDGCCNLTSMDLPEMVETIGNYAFKNTVRMSSLHIPFNSRLRSIGNFAFAFSGLRAIDLPQNLSIVNGSAFYGATSMVKINVNKNNAYFLSDNGVLFNKTRSNIVTYPAGKSGVYELPEITETINEYAFAFTKMQGIDLKHVKRIKEFAFILSNLETVSLPDTLISLGANVFSYNYNLSFVDLGRGITTIPENSFLDNIALKNIAVPSQITEIGLRAFKGARVENIEFNKESTLRIIGYEAFYGCPISKLDAPNSLMMIGGGAFKKCYDLSKVTFQDNSALFYIGQKAFEKTVSLINIVFPSELREIDNYAFLDSGIGGEVKISANVQTIGVGAFAACHNLININVDENNQHYLSRDGVVYTKDGAEIVAYPAGKALGSYSIQTGTKKVGDASFYGAWNLKEVIAPMGVSDIGEYSFYSCINVTSYSLPNTLSSIGQYAFAQNIALTNISIPDEVVLIGRYAFEKDNSLRTISFGEDSKLARIGYATFADCGITSFRVPSNVSTIAQNAFANCNELTNIVFAKNSKLANITAYQFDGCSNITNITFEQGSALTQIQAHGFEGMAKLTSVDFGDAQLIEIDNFAFRFCESLSTLKLPSTLINIGRFAFYNCKNLSQLNLPYGLEHIGKFAFLGASNCSIYFEAESLPMYLDENWDYGIVGYYTGVSTIETSSDGNYKVAILADGTRAIIEYLGKDKDIDLTAVNFGGDIVNIGGYAFYNKDVTSIILPNTLKQIQRYAFAANKNLASITIPSQTNYIANYAFYNTGIASLTFDGNNVKIIEQYAFSFTKNLKSVTIPASVTRMGAYAFYASGIESVIFADGCLLTEIPDGAFASTALQSVRIPESVKTIGRNSFRDNMNLTSVDFGTTEKLRINANAFYNTGLTAVYIPANVEYIGEYAFVGLKNLREFGVNGGNEYYCAIDGVLFNKSGTKLISFPAGKTGIYTVPNQVESIGFGAFENTALSEVKFADNINLLTFGYRAFYNADLLTSILIPASMVSIDYYAFAQCDKLTTIDFSTNNALKGIYEGAFYGCTNLKNITLPNSIVEVSDYAFYGCLSLDRLPVGDNSQLLGVYSYSFAYTGIDELALPSSLLDIGEYAFSGLNITELTVPEENKQDLVIGLGAFADCNKLEKVTLPFIGASYENEEITWFGYIFGAGGYAANATYVPSSLKHVTITDGISFVGMGAFCGLTTIETLDMPTTVGTLYFDAFNSSTIKYELSNPVKLLYKDGHASTGVSDSFFGKGISGKLELTDSIKDVFYGAFMDCVYLSEMIIPDSVTSIGDNAFEGCTRLTSITIPDSVTSIGSDTFSGCTGLTSVTIPDSVTSIDIYAFRDCTGLTNITIPDSVTSIGYGAFYNCTGLTSVTIPDSVTNIGSSAFRGCTGLTSVTIPDSVTSIGYMAFLDCTGLTSVTIPDSVTSIGNDAFRNCTGLTSITIPDSVTSIGYGAFYGCRSLLSLDIPDGMEETEINQYTFGGCDSLQSLKIGNGPTSIGYKAFYEFKNLTDITIPDSVTNIGGHAFGNCTSLIKVEIGSGVTSIETGAFYNCESLSGVYIKDLAKWCGIAYEGFDYTPLYYARNLYLNGELVSNLVIPDSVTSICDNAFEGCTGLTSVTIPDSVTSIGSSAFSGCTGLTSVTIGNGVTSIGSSAFSNCNRLYEVINNSDLSIALGSDDYGLVAKYAKVIVDKNGNKTYKDGEFSYIDTIDGFKFGLENGKYILYSYNGTEDTITLPESINGNPYEIYRFVGGKNIIIPDTITSIGDEAFKGNESLVSITIGNGVTSIGEDAFASCYGLTSVTIPDSVTSIGWSAFEGCTGLTSVTIPDSVTSIGSRTFAECTGLTSVTIGNSVTSIGFWAFHGCTGLTSITVAKGNTKYHSAENCLIETESKTLIAGCKNSIIPTDGSVTRIGEWAFYNCTGLMSVTIPDSVTSIGSLAFYNCYGLTSITIPDSVTSIGNSAFSNCTGLTSVTIGGSVTSIGDSAFSGCYRLIEVYNKSTLSITVGSSSNGYVAYYAKNVYKNEGESKLTTDENGYVIYTDGYEKILVAYHGTNTELALPSYITKINKYAFYNCSKIESIVIPDSVTNIGEYAFGGCTGLTNITIGKGITLINKSTFDGCSELSSIYYNGDVAGWCGISGLNNLPSGSRTLYIGGNKVEGDLIIPDGVTSIADYAFYSCKEITSLTIPASLTSIGESAFLNCTKISTIYYMGDVAGWCGISGLYNIISCSCLYIGGNQVEGDLIIPDGVTSIGDYAFYYREITSVTIPASLTSIGESAFLNCTKISTIYYMGDVAGWCGISGLYNIISCSCLYIGGNQVEGDLIIPDGVTSIGDYAFYHCKEIASIRIPDSITYIGDYAFVNCDKLANIVVSENNNSYSSVDGILYDKNKTRLIFVPPAIQGAITIPDSVTSIGSDAFYGCSGLTSIIVSENNNSFSSVDGILYNKDKTQIIFVPQAIQGVITIPDSVRHLNSGTFSHRTGLTGVVIGKGVTSIGQAFWECSGLTNISIPDSVTSIDSAFGYCTSLTSITIGNGVTTIGSSAFEGCSALLEVINNSDLPITLGSNDYGRVAYYALVLVDKNGNKTYKDKEFTYIDTVDGFRFVFVNGKYVLCAYIGTNDTITLPDSINGNSYEINCFKGGQKVVLPDWMTSIDGNAFWRNSTVTEIVIPDSVTSIGGYAFSECTGLTSVTIGNSVTSIGQAAFSDCTGLTSITIPDSVTSIGDWAFSGCTGLTSITIPNSVTSIGGYAFSECTGLKSIKIGNSLISIGSGAIESTGIQRIGSDAFKGTAYYNNPENWIDNCLFIGDILIAVDKQLTYLETDHNISAIAIDAFNDCYLLKQVKLGGYVARNYNLLASTTNVETIVLSGNQLQHLYYYYGVDWSSIPSLLKNVIILSDCEMVNSELFVGASNLRIFVEKAREDCMWDENYPGWNSANKVLYKGDWAKAIWRDTIGKIIEVDYYSASEVVKPPFISVPDSEEQRYRFVGWDTNGDGIVDGIPATLLGNIDATAIIVSEKAEYLVEFIDKDGETVIWSYLSNYNQKIVLPENPQKNGYEFVGWKDYSDELVVTSNMKLYSIWSHQSGEHVYEDRIIEPTCTEQGYTIHTCTICGESYKTDFVDALGHRFGEWTIDVEATCHNAGSKHRSCDCGEVATEEIAQLQHEFVSEVVKEPSCTAEGERLYECALCGDKYTEDIAKTAHKYRKKYTTKENMAKVTQSFDNIFCGYEGDKAYYFECEVCGRLMEENESMLVGTASVQSKCSHVGLGDWEVAIEPSCVDGMEVRKCLKCGKVAEARKIGANGIHNYGDWYEVTAPDCVHTGTKCRDCQNCTHCETGIIEALGHDFAKEWTIDVPATCTEKGSKSHHCSRCDVKSEVTEIGALGHDLVHHDAKTPTCTEIGWEAYDTCSRCDYTTYKELPALNHNYNAVVTEPTCIEQGYTTHTCSRCNDSYVDSYKDALGHDLVHHDAKAPTCTEIGWEAYDTCSRCDYTTYKELPALDHNYNAVVTDPTCTEQGYTTHTCTRCNDSYVDSYKNALGHDLVHHDAKASTCTEIGWEAYDTCSRCDYTTYNELPARGHDFAKEWTIDVPATCTEKGSKSHHCSRCDVKADVTDIEAKGHRFGEWVKTLDPSYDEEGKEQRKCADCDEIETRGIEKLSRGPLVFADMVNAITNEKGDAKLKAINNALAYYNTLTEDEKERASASYEALQQAINTYKQEVETENRNKNILIISLIGMTLLISGAVAIGIISKKKHIKRQK